MDIDFSFLILILFSFVNSVSSADSKIMNFGRLVLFIESLCSYSIPYSILKTLIFLILTHLRAQCWKMSREKPIYLDITTKQS